MRAEIAAVVVDNKPDDVMMRVLYFYGCCRANGTTPPDPPSRTDAGARMTRVASIHVYAAFVILAIIYALFLIF